MSQFDTEYEWAPICPYCGKNDSDDRHDGEGSYTYTCGSCSKEYKCQVHVTVRYTTKPIEGEREG